MAGSNKKINVDDELEKENKTLLYTSNKPQIKTFGVYDNMVLEKETTCGIWYFKGRFLQKFANKKAYVLLYGMLGCMCTASYAYHNATITTLEKRFKIPSKITGIITIGNDLSQLFVSVVLSYYTGRKHRPRWIALGLYTVVLYCLLTALPHWLYGAGEDALLLTEEFGESSAPTTTTMFKKAIRKTLCHNENSTSSECAIESGNYIPPVIFFCAQFISGIGGPLYYTLGISYMDDNIRKSKTPAFLSFSIFLRMLGPAIGYALASMCLKIYISPSLTPLISNKDPRWLGAWWLGWLILATFIFVLGSLLALFPKTLPRAAARKLNDQKTTETKLENETKPSFKDMKETFKRIVTNPVLMTNNFAAIFYFFGYMPYWIFLPKYIETQYRQSSSASSLITGTVGLVFSAIGVLLSGLVISKYKPRARYLAAWNVIVGFISVCGILSYAYLGCVENDNRVPLSPTGELDPILPCNSDCDCDYVKYSPVCAVDGKSGFISACHAGCKKQYMENGTRIYADCSCIKTETNFNNSTNGYAKEGNCFIDCISKFYTFLAVVCLLKFSGATGRASNFLVTVRCVDEKDKPVAMGFGLMMMSLCAFVPSPILFGIILDKTCLLWGKTCTGNGNCWLYNGETLRYTMNFTAAFFVLIGTFFDLIVWYLVKGLKIFDEEVKDIEFVRRMSKFDGEILETEINSNSNVSKN